eukprot:4829079-Pleurochrysis_carterae.AAC.1
MAWPHLESVDDILRASACRCCDGWAHLMWEWYPSLYCGAQLAPGLVCRKQSGSVQPASAVDGRSAQSAKRSRLARAVVRAVGGLASA